MDYSKLGLKVGLEIHQQLNADTKLFCRCPIKKSEGFAHSVRRRLRPVAGELGDVDRAALYEFLRNRVFVYRYSTNSSCLVELDEDPPKGINEKALGTALEICKLLNCDIISELQVMRKTVIDGSSVSGFQRTVLVGMNGRVETSFGNVGIETVCLEEDSAPAVKKEGGMVEYRLDRALVPLVEISTSPDIRTPEQAKEAAERLGMLLRSVDVVRGIGSIRQDINISVEGGARVEVKGFQELEKIPKLIENEALRQAALLKLREELKKRGIKAISSVPSDVTEIFRSTKNSMLRKIASEKGKIFSAKLPFAGLMKLQCGHHTFGKEMASYAEAHNYGIIHSDEDLGKYHVFSEFSRIREKLGAGNEDIVFIVAGKEPEKAAAAVIERAKQCFAGVPEETRIGHEAGSKYARPLPGRERMYPETDVPPVRITEKRISSAKAPETLIEKEKKLKKALPRELAEQLVRSHELNAFERFSRDYRIDPTVIAVTLLSTMKDLRRRKLNADAVTEDALANIFMLVEQKKLSKDSIPKALEMLCVGKQMNDVIHALAMLSEKEIRAIIRNIVKNSPKAPESALMGVVMQQARGRADGKTVIRILREEMK